jgi:MazG family protein
VAAGEAFDRLVELMARLRGPGGCPWDRKQTLETLKPFIIEEAYELVDSIDSGAIDSIREELGDLVLEALFVSQICAEEGKLTMEQVLTALEDKLVRRHPHVFGTRPAADADEALGRWEDIKAREKEEKSASLLHDVPRALPALKRAAKLSARAARVGFDWPSVADVLRKLEEELRELERAHGAGDASAVAEEVGDLLFVVANLARHLGVDPEQALEATNRKFVTRFRHIEERLRAEGRSVEEASLEELEAFWTEAKAKDATPASET